MSELLPSCGGEFPDYECDQEAVGLVWVIDRVEARCGGHWSSTGSVLKVTRTNEQP